MTAILWMLGGAAAGAGGAVALYVLGFGVELLNCTCQILSCNLDGGDAIPGMWNGESFGNVLIFCIIGGAIVGLFYGLYKMKAEADEEELKKRTRDSEEAKRQRLRWADEIKQKALNVNETCEQNRLADKPLVSTTYQASAQMKNIIDELTKAAELQGKIDGIADNLIKKGDAE